MAALGGVGGGGLGGGQRMEKSRNKGNFGEKGRKGSGYQKESQATSLKDSFTVFEGAEGRRR